MNFVLKHFFTILLYQNVMENCFRFVPRKYYVLQIGDHQRFVMFQQIIQNFSPWQIFHFVHVLGEYAQTVFGKIFQDPSGKFKNQIFVITA
jgi:hypothetical protein